MASAPIDPLLVVAASGAGVSDDVIESLYRSHRERLLGLAAAITLDRTLAEEVVQDAFVGLQRHAGDIENPLGYLQRSVVNLGVSILRRRRVVDGHQLRPPRPVSSPEVDETWSAVVRLPAHQRAVVVLRFWEDMTVAAMAVTLDWPEGSVKSTLHRALKRLKEELS